MNNYFRSLIRKVMDSVRLSKNQNAFSLYVMGIKFAVCTLAYATLSFANYWIIYIFLSDIQIITEFSVIEYNEQPRLRQKIHRIQSILWWKLSRFETKFSFFGVKIRSTNICTHLTNEFGLLTRVNCHFRDCGTKNPLIFSISRLHSLYYHMISTYCLPVKYSDSVKSCHTLGMGTAVVHRNDEPFCEILAYFGLNKLVHEPIIHLTLHRGNINNQWFPLESGWQQVCKHGIICPATWSNSNSN